MAMPRNDLPFCDCRWLERAARDPRCPIEFDAELNEYKLKTSNGSMCLYHCPFCAGRAPESLRARLFATISDEETTRLFALTKGFRTEDDVRRGLGDPTHVFEPGGTMMTAEKDGDPREVRAWKSLRYENYSDTATINVNVDQQGNVRIAFMEKTLPKPSPA